MFILFPFRPSARPGHAWLSVHSRGNGVAVLPSGASKDPGELVRRDLRKSLTAHVVPPPASAAIFLSYPGVDLPWLRTNPLCSRGPCYRGDHLPSESSRPRRV